MSEMFCNPDICPNCQYIGGGDSICDATLNIVLDDWQPTEYSMYKCPFLKKKKKDKKKKDKKKRKKEK